MGFTISKIGAFDTNGLSKAWPIEMPYQAVASLELANLNVSLGLVDIAELIKRLLTNAFAVGGKGRG